MAAPNNLSLHSSFPSAQQQSLRTPDASSLFSSSPSLPTPHDIRYMFWLVCFVLYFV